jgi:Beta/Gamma crystallin
MSRRAVLCTAISVAALAVGVATEASAATVTRTNTVVRTTTAAKVTPRVTTTPRVNTTVRTNTRVNVGTANKTIRTTTTTTQFKKLNTGGTGAGTGAGAGLANKTKFQNKPIGSDTLHATPATLKVNPNLKLSPAVKLGPSKFNPAVLQNKGQFVHLGNNKFAPLWKQKHGLWWGGKWKYFVPFTVLGAVAIGGAYYYPDAYVGFARPYCSGLTPDGCQLNWQQVNFEDGGSDWQCVQYCRRPGAIPPPQAAALVTPPPMPQGSCEVTIYSDPNFGGTGVTTGEEQPALSQSGWQNQIASIQVKSGTWDFFSDENFTGAPMRLQPGPYQDLGPEWTKKIGSFMCVQPGS